MTSVASKRRNRLSDLSNATIKKHPKVSGLVCLVCGAPATGFNFSVITCMCCKAFFRRNALFGLEAYQCRYLTEKCAVNMRTRRDCSYCRLNKCFQVGMKKELILTDDVKRLKREKLHANKQMTLSLTQRTNLLKDDELIYLRHLGHAYEELCRLPIMAYEKREYEAICHQPMKSRIKFQHYFEAYHVYQTSLEAFFKCLSEFQQFPIEEQKALCTHNIQHLMRINAVETLNDSIPTWGAIHFLIEIIYGKPLIDKIDDCLRQFKYHLNDSRCIQLLLIIILFSTSSNYTGHLDTLILYKIQEKYTQLLWIYLQGRYGELVACQKFALIIRYCLHLRTIHHTLELKKQETEWQEFFVFQFNQ
jgi:hypothetical protein